MPLSPEATTELRSIMQQTIATDDGQAATIPGAACVVVDRAGDELFAHAAGRSSIRSPDPLTLDSVLWMASCTKMVAGVACMQLVERGDLALDDVAQVEELCPELKEIKVLKEDGTFEEKKRGITLRMLLTHTAGFGYTFLEETLRDWSMPAGIDEFSGDVRDIYKIPLRFQPGERWMYGIGLDWAGIMLERKTGLSLNDYTQENICRPLGLENVNFLPTQAMKKNLATIHARQADGTLVPRDPPQRRPLVVETPEETASVFHSGGGGLFAKPQEYARILAVLLNDGTCPRTGARLLTRATVDAMFANQIPRFPQFGRQGIPGAKPDLSNPLPDLYPIAGDPPQGWGLSFMLSGANPVTGRSEETGYWAGLANTFWWCDRGRGVAGFVGAQILPFGDPAVAGLWWRLEEAVYRNLAAV
ncbi:beta-lactamase family protein [Hypoxylon sp. FL1150]|nr:beta-lactamase family protein [Hypoxylon sp. FL1150]